MTALLRRTIVALTAVGTAVFTITFAVEQYKSRQRRKDQAKEIATLLGTVYPHDHKNL
jgi:hypothetical protein